MHTRQRGITLIGWLFLLIPLAIVVYAGIRLTPIYLNYSKVARAMDQVVTEFKGDESISAATIRSSIEKRLDIESVSFPTMKEFEVRRDGQAWIVHTRYEDVAPLVSNISMLLAFDKTVQIE